VVAVVDSEGREVARWPELPQYLGIKPAAWGEFHAKNGSRREPLELRGLDGVKRFYYFTSAPNSNGRLWVAAGISQSRVLAHVRSQLIWRVGAATLLTLVCFFASWYGSEVFFVRPVRSLMTAAQRLAKGDLSARTQFNNGPGEFSALSQSFDQMASALQQQQEELRRTQFAVDFAPEPILWAASDGRITYANDAAAGAFGRSIRELLELRFQDLVLSLSAGEWQRHWAELHKEGILVFESVCRTRNGKQFPVEITANHLRFGGDERQCAFIRNITNRKRAEAALRELNASLEERVRARTAALEAMNASLTAEINERQRIEASLQERERALSTLMSNIPGMAYRCLNDAAWTMKMVSEGALDLTGYTADELLDNQGVSYSDLVLLEDRPAVRAAVDEGLEKRAPFRMLYRIACRDGKIKWVSEQGRGVFDKTGHLEALEGIIHDTTDRKTAEDELAQAHQMLELILDHIPQRVFWKDRSFKYLGCNRSYALAKGLASPQEIVGKSDYDINVTKDADRFRNDDRWVMDNDKAKLNYEEPLTVTDGGGERWLRTTKTPLHDSEGRVIGVLCTYEDITEQRQMERKLRESLTSLEQSNRELEQFAYVASHDLQEPLRLISSYTQLIASKYGNSLDATGHEFAGFVVEGCERLRRLIQDLLAYSRVTSQNAPSTLCDSGACLKTALNHLAVVIEENNARIEIGPMPAVLAAENHLVQLFQNLIANAIKFRAEATPEIHITATASEDQTEWVFRVQDNGIGISSDFFDRIFAIFQRLHSRRKYAGTGIGLAVCKRIVERHGGRIWVESEPGKGSAFLFALRAANTPAV
jgi:PAS domain S-box-containing protein